MSKVEDGTPGFEEKFGQDRDSVAEATRKKWLAELLANERAVGPLLVYLKDTEVGSREGAVEKTMEWRRRTTGEFLAPRNQVLRFKAF